MVCRYWVSRFPLAAIVAVMISPCVSAWAQNNNNQNNVNPIGMFMDRGHFDTYVPGTEVVVQVNISVQNSGRVINAIGLRETIPAGWSYLGSNGGAAPQVEPSPGEQGLLEFAWIEIPAPPFGFSYTLGVPESDPGGLQTLHGALEYRLAGSAKYAPPTVTTITGERLDRDPPDIQLNGGGSVMVPFGGPWNDPGATATDNVDGDVSGRIRTSGFVNVNEPGTYTVTYSVTDAAGNTATETRQVTVLLEGQDPATDDPAVGDGSSGTAAGTANGNNFNFAGGGGGGASARDNDRTRSGNEQNRQNNANNRVRNQQQNNNRVAQNATKNSRQLRPGVVQRGEDPRSGVVIPKNPPQPGAQSTTPAAGQVSATTTPATSSGGGGARTAAATTTESGKQLSDEWPELYDETQLAQVRNVEDAEAVTNATGGADREESVGALPVLAAVAACAGILALVFFVSSQMVYSGQRRRKPVNKS